MSSRTVFGAPRERSSTRFRRLDNTHISAIESLSRTYPFLRDRVETHLPSHRAKAIFESSTVWVWPKFDKRPVGFLVFLEGFPPCMWYPDRQEGMALRWLLPPLFSEKGPTLCLANLLTGESVLQIEDILIHQGKDVWSTHTFSARWEVLRGFWNSLPPDQPLLALTPRIVTPISLEDWPYHYDFAIYWIIQSDQARQTRWFWKDVATLHSHASVTYVAPQLKRDKEIISQLCAYCTPYTKMVLPDAYSLCSQEGESLGLAAISTMTHSTALRSLFSEKTGAATGEEKPEGVPVEVVWNDNFKKYTIVRILPAETPITTFSFFRHHLSDSM